MYLAIWINIHLSSGARNVIHQRRHPSVNELISSVNWSHVNSSLFCWYIVISICSVIIYLLRTLICSNVHWIVVLDTVVLSLRFTWVVNCSTVATFCHSIICTHLLQPFIYGLWITSVSMSLIFYCTILLCMVHFYYSSMQTVHKLHSFWNAVGFGLKSSNHSICTSDT